MRRIANRFVPGAALIAGILFAEGCAAPVAESPPVQQPQSVAPPVERKNRKPWTLRLRRDSNISDDEVKQLQFFTVGDILLRRDVPHQNAEVSKLGVLRMENGKLIEEVIIKSGTAGVALMSDEKMIGMHVFIAFDDTENTLTFYPASAVVMRAGSQAMLIDGGPDGFAMRRELGPPTVHYRGEGMDYYTMVADSWGFDPSTHEWRGYVDYAGNKYMAIGPTAHAYLAIDATLLADEKKSQKVLPGRSVNRTATAQDGESPLPDAN